MTKRKFDLSNKIFAKIHHLTTILIICLVALLLWSFWPSPQVAIISKLSPSLLLTEELYECQLLNQLLNSEFLLRYPHTIGFQESGSLFFEINPPSNKLDEYPKDCLVVIETSLEIRDLIIRPGSLVIEPYRGQKQQMVVYHFQLNQPNRNQKGNFWVYAVINHNESQAIRIPLFAYPIQIELKQFLGLSPRITRMGTISILIFILVVRSSKLILAK